MQLILMRHAESEGNRQGRIQGHGEDGLTPLGCDQARRLAAQLCQQPAPTALYCSPLRRAQATLAILRSHCPGAAALPIHWDAALQELDPGILAGLTWSEAQARYPELCRRLETTSEILPVPQAESPQAARQRAAQVLRALLERHTESDRIWIVTHGGFLVHLVSEILGCDRSWGLAIAPTAWFDFYLTQASLGLEDENRFNPVLWKINHFNNSGHLNC